MMVCRIELQRRESGHLHTKAPDHPIACLRKRYQMFDAMKCQRTSSERVGVEATETKIEREGKDREKR